MTGVRTTSINCAGQNYLGGDVPGGTRTAGPGWSFQAPDETLSGSRPVSGYARPERRYLPSGPKLSAIDLARAIEGSNS